MRPSQVLDCQADLLTRMESVPGFLEYVANCVELDAKANQSPGLDTIALRHAVKEPMVNAVKTALTYKVTEDMSMLVQHAADQLDDTDRFSRHEAPNPSGIVHFDKALPLQEVRGRTMLIHWAVWGPVLTNLGPATIAFFFNDDDIEPDEVWTERPQGMPEKMWAEVQEGRNTDVIRKVIGRWSWIGFDFYFDDQRLGPRLQDTNERYAEQLRSEGVIVMPSGNSMRYMKALWMLLDQTVTVIEDEQADRATRRRMGKMRLPQRVQVIKLRRSKNANRGEGESMVEWSHRWVVRGHWRWQPYGSRGHDHDHEMFTDGTSRVCARTGCDRREERIWISPYVKGPEDRPFFQTEKVHVLER